MYFEKIPGLSYVGNRRAYHANLNAARNSLETTAETTACKKHVCFNAISLIANCASNELAIIRINIALIRISHLTQSNFLIDGKLEWNIRFRWTQISRSTSLIAFVVCTPEIPFYPWRPVVCFAPKDTTSIVVLWEKVGLFSWLEMFKYNCTCH